VAPSSGMLGVVLAEQKATSGMRVARPIMCQTKEALCVEAVV
jgi:hypothetical protein